jgi:hypothetical protein
MGFPTGPADWHLAVGLWQWDHPDPRGDYLNSNPSVVIYDYEYDYNSIFDFHRISWGNRATCSALYVGPGYQSGDHVDILTDCNNAESLRFTMDPRHPPNPNPDHPGILFYEFKQQGIGEHGGAGLEFVIVPSSPMEALPPQKAVEQYEKDLHEKRRHK